MKTLNIQKMSLKEAKEYNKNLLQELTALQTMRDNGHYSPNLLNPRIEQVSSVLRECVDHIINLENKGIS